MLEPEDVEIRPLLAQVVAGLGETGARIELDEGTDAPVERDRSTPTG